MIVCVCVCIYTSPLKQTEMWHCFQVNVRRFEESLCINGVVTCAAAHTQDPEVCAKNNSMWGNYAPDKVSVHHKSIANVTKIGKTTFSSEPENLAATVRGGGLYSSQVDSVTVDTLVGDDDEVELLLLTCQGFELQALQGASHLLETQRLRNIIFRMHSRQQVPDAPYHSQMMAQMLLEKGFSFFDIQDCRANASAHPVWIPNDLVQTHVKNTCTNRCIL